MLKSIPGSFIILAISETSDLVGSILLRIIAFLDFSQILTMSAGEMLSVNSAIKSKGTFLKESPTLFL